MGVFSSILSQYKYYIDQWKKHLQDHWGVNKNMAEKGAALVILLHLYGILNSVTSGYRSPEYQKQLYDRWLAGDKSVYMPAKPGTSPHQRRIALDISCKNYAAAHWIAGQLGIKTLGMKDPVHFQVSS